MPPHPCALAVRRRLDDVQGYGLPLAQDFAAGRRRYRRPRELVKRPSPSDRCRIVSSLANLSIAAPPSTADAERGVDRLSVLRRVSFAYPEQSPLRRRCRPYRGDAATIATSRAPRPVVTRSVNTARIVVHLPRLLSSLTSLSFMS